MLARIAAVSITTGRATMVVLGILAFPFVLAAHMTVHAVGRGFGAIAALAAGA